MNIFRLAAFLLLTGLVLFLQFGCGSDETVIPDEPCSLTITSPSAAETIWLGNLAAIRWTRTGDLDEVRLRLAKAGTVVGEIAATTPNDGYFPWTPTNMGAALGTDFSILVDAPGEAECAAASEDFRLAVCGLEIQTAVWPSQVSLGDTLLLLWNRTDTSGRVDIDLMKGGQIVGNIATAFVTCRIANDPDGLVLRNWYDLKQVHGKPTMLLLSL